MTLTSAKLIHHFQDAQGRPVGERIAFWTQRLLEEPGLLAPLGSCPSVSDTAPIFPKAYDCTTYVETVAALARSREGVTLADQIISIRYRDGKIGFETRNHFPEADWIPNNVAAGNMKDITMQVARAAGRVVSFATKEIDKAAWLKACARPHPIARSRQTTKTVGVQLAYIPIEQMADVLARCPRAPDQRRGQNRSRYPVLISHQGFFSSEERQAWFRHASRNQKIAEIPFERYVEQMREMPWKVVGFNLNAFSG